MFDPYYRLHNLLGEYESEIEDIAFLFDRLDLTHKVEAVNSLKGVEPLQALWDKAARSEQLLVSDLVPADIEPDAQVIFHCHGSQRAFPDFNLVCCRPSVTVGKDEAWGYSETYVKGLVGPGYYTLHNSLRSPHGTIAFDYTLVPPEAPADWPKVRPNTIGLSKRVYDGLITYVRFVAEDVFVAANTKDDKETGVYFALVRLL